MKTNAISMSNWDRKSFAEIIESSAEAKEDINQNSKAYGPYKDLFTDVFASLYKGGVSLNKRDEMRESHLLNHAIMESALIAPEYKSLHIKTTRDPEAALLASLTFADKLFNEKDENGNPKWIDKETQEAWSKLDQIEKQLNFYESLFNDEPNSNVGSTVEQLRKEKREIFDNMDLEAAQKGILKAVNVVAGEVKAEIQEIQQAIHSYGLEEGRGQKMSARERFELARRIKEKRGLHQLAKWLGRLRRIARSTKKTEKIPEEVVTVTNGNDLPKVLLGEYAYLNAGLRDLFYQKFAEKQLLQFDMRKPDGQGMGPFVIALDTSGSMMGERDAFAKALAIAFIEIGRIDKRDVWVVIFGGQRTTSFYLDHQNHDPKTVVLIAEEFINGGTDFDIPVNRTIDILRSKQGKKADLIFLSDGEGHVSEDVVQSFNELKQQNNARALAITIGGYSANVGKFCDKVISHAKIGDDLAKEIYEWAVR